MRSTLLLFLIVCISFLCSGQHPADNYSVFSLVNLNFNRVATKLTSAQLANVSPSHWGFRWNSGDNSTLKWRPQGISGVEKDGVNFIAVSWYGRSNQGYEDRGARISFVDLTDENNLVYRHVLLVDDNYNTFPDLHAGGITYVNDTLYVGDSRSGGKYLLRFDINKIKQVPTTDLASFYNYGYILQAVSVDTVPIKPSFLSYDWDSQELVVGSFNYCGTPYCTNNAINTMAWQSIGDFNTNSPYYINFFGKMQGAVSRNHFNNDKKMFWASTSYGSGNNSYLYASSFDPGLNNAQSQPVSLGQNYNSYVFPPGLEDLHITPQSDTIWTLTEFGTNEGSNNNRDVFAIAVNDILPPGTCSDTINITQDLFQDEFLCKIVPLNYEANTDYVSYATFQSSLNNWIDINETRTLLANTDRSVFMWVRKNTSTSTEVLCGINTSSGGNISNLQIGSNNTLQIYDGSSSNSGSTNVADGQWHMVGYTYNEGTSETKVYVDGVEEFSFNTVQTVTATSSISLGQEFDSGNISNLYNGDMTEVSIWNTVLLPSEINLLATKVIETSHPKYSNLVAHYSMNDICGGDLAIIDDESSNGFDGLASHPTILSLSNLAQLPGFNSAEYFSKDWIVNGSFISSMNTVNLTNYDQETYSLALTRNNISILDSWILDYNTNVDVQNHCNSFMWIDGNTYTSDNNTATYNFAGGSQGICDTLVTLDLTISNSSAGIDTKTECSPYTWIDGNTYISNNNSAIFNIVGGASNGCDSLVTLNLTINAIDNTVSINNETITSNALNAAYQWIDCNINTPILNEVNQSFIATSNGSYAVVVSKGNCSDTSNCVAIQSTSILENSEIGYYCYPNPTSGKTELDFGELNNIESIQLYSIDGRKVLAITNFNEQLLKIDISKEPKGIYFLTVINNDSSYLLRVIKE